MAYRIKMKTHIQEALPNEEVKKMATHQPTKKKATEKKKKPRAKQNDVCFDWCSNDVIKQNCNKI